MTRTIWCPNCGTKINYKEPKGACPIDEYPRCGNCDTYIYLVVTEEDYVLRQIKITMTNC